MEKSLTSIKERSHKGLLCMHFTYRHPFCLQNVKEAELYFFHYVNQTLSLHLQTQNVLTVSL